MHKIHGFANPIRESGISYLRFTRFREGPHAGLDEKVSYLDATGRPQPDDSGEYGYRRVFDDRGLIRESVMLGPSLEDRPNNYGILKTVQTRDPAGNVIESSFLDAKGELALSGLGVAGAWLRYDDAGNMSRSTYRDRSGAPISIPSIGIAGSAMTYDRQGRIKSMTFLGPEDKPVMLSGYAEQKYEWLTPSRAVIRTYGPNYDFANRLELFKGDRPREVTVERAGQIVGLDLPAGRMSGFTLEEQPRTEPRRPAPPALARRSFRRFVERPPSRQSFATATVGILRLQSRIARCLGAKTFACITE